MRTRSTVAAVAAACVAASALAACGIPEDSHPEVVEPAPTDLDRSTSNEDEVYMPSDDALDTVESFLRASSGDPAARDDRLAEFTGERTFSDPTDGISLLDNVAFDSEESSDFNTVTVTVSASVIGIYELDGRFRVNDPPRAYEEEFVLERENFGDVFSVVTWPQQVAMLYSQFEDTYQKSPLYFLASGTNDLLVPDLRWIYDTLDAATAREIRLGWLLQGPSEWTRVSARTAIPTGTTPQTTDDDGKVVIDLTPGSAAEIDDATTNAMAAQIAWSLDLSGELELRVNGERVATGSLADWREWNAIPSDMGETAYYAADDTIWQFQSGSIARTSADHPWVGFQTQGLQQVAVAENAQIAATVSGDNGSTLRIGTEPAEMNIVEGVTGDLRDPQWVRDGTVLLIDDGVLTAVDIDSGGTQVLGGDEVTALAVAPDGRRAAYVEDGRAFVAPLSIDADGNFQLHEAEARQIGSSVTDVRDVAWSAEDYIWIAGLGPEDQQLYRAAIDNSQLVPQAGTSGFPRISQIAANAADPLARTQTRGEPVIVVIGDHLYRVHTSNMDSIETEDGQGVEGSAPFTVLE